MSKTIIIDPGHGGFDPGAVYENRKEKDDNLRLALAVGQELQNAGYQIIYTRTDDRYDSPYDKAQIANSAGGDLFLSFHRNFAETPDLYQGVQALVYDKNPLALRVAKMSMKTWRRSDLKIWALNLARNSLCSAALPCLLFS